MYDFWRYARFGQRRAGLVSNQSHIQILVRAVSSIFHFLDEGNYHVGSNTGLMNQALHVVNVVVSRGF